MDWMAVLSNKVTVMNRLRHNMAMCFNIFWLDLIFRNGCHDKRDAISHRIPSTLNYE